MILTERDNGALIEVKRGSIITIRLPDEAASSGYQWMVELSGDLKVIRQSYEPANGPGELAMRVVELRADAAGRHALKLIKRRSWEGEGTEIGSFGATIVAA